MTISHLEVLVGFIVFVVIALVVRHVALEARKDAQQRAKSFDLIQHLRRQRFFSMRTFGPGERTTAVIAHIRKELNEIEENPNDITEWSDLLLLAFDGALRRGFSPEQIAQALTDKLSINEQRTWPDWRTADPNKPIEHTKTVEERDSTEPMRMHIDAEWLARRIENDGDEPTGLLACNPKYLSPDFLESLRNGNESDALANEAQALTDDLIVLAAQLRRLAEARTAQIRALESKKTSNTGA